MIPPDVIRQILENAQNVRQETMAGLEEMLALRWWKIPVRTTEGVESHVSWHAHSKEQALRSAHAVGAMHGWTVIGDAEEHPAFKSPPVGDELAEEASTAPATPNALGGLTPDEVRERLEPGDDEA